MNFEEKQKWLLAIEFLDMDFDKLPALLGKYLQEQHGEKEWSQTQVAAMLGKDRSHVNKAERNTSDMGITQLFMYYVINDIDMNEMMRGFFEELLKAPRVLHKKK